MRRTPLLLLSILAVAGCSEPTAVQPVRVAAFELALPPQLSSTVVVGQEIDLRELVAWARNEAGGELSADDLARIPGLLVRWAWSEGHSGVSLSQPKERREGWTVPVPLFETDGFAPNVWGAYPLRLDVWITGAGPGQLHLWGALGQPPDYLPHDPG